MSAALECWSGRPSTDDDSIVEQILISDPHSSSSSSSPSHHHPLPPKWHLRISRNITDRLNKLRHVTISDDPLSPPIKKPKLPFNLCGCKEDDPTGPTNLPSPLPSTTFRLSVDDRGTLRCPIDDFTSRYVLEDLTNTKKLWIKKVKSNEFQIRYDLLQLMTCGHRNILRFIGVYAADEGVCVVTRLMDAGSVRDWIAKGRRFGVREVMRVAADVAEGLMFMNEHGVAYRDLNAERILMDRQGNACLGDMGVVLPCGDGGEVTEYETAGYRWLAPEIISGDPESVTETWMSNVYSFGMVIWEMVAGEAAYSSYSPVQAAVGIAACGLRPEIPKDCPQVLRSLMIKCWNNCPSKRPTFSEIISILQKQINR